MATAQNIAKHSARLIELFSLTSSELDKTSETLLGFTVSWRYFELKVSEDEKNVTCSHSDSCESLKFIHFTGLATKSDGFFPYSFMLFTQRFVN